MCTWEAETNAYKPRDTEGELRGQREAHTSLQYAEGTRKDPYRPLPSKLWPEAQGMTVEQKHWPMIPGTKRGLAALQIC